jgi:uncharacterized protein (TIGR02594 family)
MLDEKNPLLVALSYYGEKPIAGKENDPAIVEFLEATTYPGPDTDEVPWCSAFLVWCFNQCGIETSANAAALSWLNVGEQIESPVLGDIVVLEYPIGGKKGHHVGFVIREMYDTIFVLAGNQDNTVDIKLWNKADVLEYRRY